MDAPESPSGGTRAAEVDTEIEDNGMANASEHLDQFAGDEIDEELDPPADHRNSLSPRDTPSSVADYSVPVKNKEVWKQFGCETEAGSQLREQNLLPRRLCGCHGQQFPGAIWMILVNGLHRPYLAGGLRRRSLQSSRQSKPGGYVQSLTCQRVETRTSRSKAFRNGSAIVVPRCCLKGAWATLSLASFQVERKR
ncbi:unnamed protein product, partial [Durusdinium trenchii]